jgi:adenylate cyclase
MIAAYEAGLDCYQRRDWANGIQHFGEALEAVPSDQPSRIFIDRCRYYTDNPPPENWSGVWIMDEK